MKRKFQISSLLLMAILIQTSCRQNEKVIYKSDAYSIFNDRVEQGNFKAIVVSSTEMTSDYRSPEADKYNPTIEFKFSINLRDNEMLSGENHMVTLQPENEKCATTVQFGKQLIQTAPVAEGVNLAPNTSWTIQLDMSEVLKALNEKGFYTLYNGDKLYKADFKGVYIAGSAAPLMWDFNNLGNRAELQLKDPDGDGIYETTLIMNAKSDEKQTAAQWKLSKDISAFPQYKSDYPISDAIYNLAIEEMIKAVEPDSTFRTGKEWAGVWTRDISYSIILSMAHLQPKVAKYSLLRKVKNGRIIQDTGTGGAYPVSTDRMIWSVAAWELYKVTGDQDWLQQAYSIIKNSVEDDLMNAYDQETGLVRGESSFLDWREQTYPRWMQPVDIYESENLGTNAVHYQANIVLSQMSKLLNDQQASNKYAQIAESIKKGINTHLWMKDKGYYGQYLYGRNFKSLSPRAEALGEALCVWFGIADAQQQKSVIENTPVTDFGISCIYPQIPGIPPYHNNAVWPFVQSYWALASAKAGNEKSVLESIAAVYRPSALFLTDKENFVADNGDFAGTQINSSNMLWSLSGSLSLVHEVLFGIDFRADSLVFHPFVPKALTGNRSLTNFKYRNTILNIELEGFGNKIKSFELDGRTSAIASIPSTLTGIHSIKIVLANNELTESKINKVANYTTLETPIANFSDETLSWTPIQDAKSYTILKNGKIFQKTAMSSLNVKAANYAEYQVIAMDANNISSFASEPVVVVNSKFGKIYEIEEFAPKSANTYKNYQGEGFVEISKTINRTITIPFKIDSDGTYTFSFRYANGNGPINTENKCAIRTLSVDGSFSGTIVLPQRGTNEWSNWGYANAVHVRLLKGTHQLTLSFEPSNENMNGDINQAMLDAVYFYQMKR
ncbi:MAG TPA: trehalase family glycosidase [Prolixibacteraceae bacterium]|nr:trehalase family glycosidase [Prolixibacteraceae bacterium]